MDSARLLLLLLLLLFPIAVYCVVLAMLNRRLQPTVVPGTWDFIGMLSAAAGLLLFAIPAIIRGAFEKAISGSAFAEEGPSPASVHSLLFWWWAATIGYYLLLVVGGGLLLWSRRNKTVIYNIVPAELERALEQALARLHLEATRTGDRLFIGFGGNPVAQPEPYLSAVSAAPLDAAPEPAAPPARAPAGDAVLEIDPFAALWNVTLHWRSHSGSVRREVEEELAKGLGDVRTYDNPTGTWFLGVAGFLLAMIFMVVLVLLLNLFVPRR